MNLLPTQSERREKSVSSREKQDRKVVNEYLRKLTPSSTDQEASLEQTSAVVGAFCLGIGEQVLASIDEVIQSAHHEIIIVTCFWAPSDSQRKLAATLTQIARQAISEQRLVTVKLCFSSLSVWQKLTHTRSLDGQRYGPETWAPKFGLPQQKDLVQQTDQGEIGISLSVKSIFVTPISVMHPKFIIVDRKAAYLPSCNVSWENWFEGCVTLSGPIVASFVEFYQNFWERQTLPPLPESGSSDAATAKVLTPASSRPLSTITLELENVPSMFLPSPHTAWPNFRPLMSPPASPPTPLNTFLLAAFDNASQSVYIQTPNLTSPPVLSAIMSAINRGVDISIVTSTKMMLLEQLLTAGTTTELCVKRLVRQHKERVKAYKQQQSRPGALEEGHKVPGKLSIRYYQPRLSGGDKEPVKSHLKLTIIDEVVTVLGSGNMDRASWYTSQELGVAFFSPEISRKVKGMVEQELEGRLGDELV